MAEADNVAGGAAGSSLRWLVAGLGALALSILPAQLQAQGFGSGVAVAGDQVLIADPGAVGPSGGEIRIYERGADGWEHTGSVFHPEGTEGNGFGTSLAAFGGHLLVTTLNQRDMAQSGVHAYARNAGGDWEYSGRLAADGLEGNLFLGLALAIEGDVAAVSAVNPMAGDGSVLVFRNAGEGWVQEQLLEDPGTGPGGFGASVSLTGGTLVAGAPLVDSRAGAAYVFEQGDDGWTLAGELSGSGAENSFFGVAAVAMGDRVLVSEGSGQGEPGVLIGFSREDGEWVESGRLAAFDGGSGDAFGGAMATDGETLWVGAPGANGRRGAVYEFSGAGPGGGAR